MSSSSLTGEVGKRDPRQQNNEHAYPYAFLSYQHGELGRNLKALESSGAWDSSPQRQRCADRSVMERQQRRQQQEQRQQEQRRSSSDTCWWSWDSFVTAMVLVSVVATLVYSYSSSGGSIGNTRLPPKQHSSLASSLKQHKQHSKTNNNTMIVLESLKQLDNDLPLGTVFFRDTTVGFDNAARVWRDDIDPPLAVVQVANEDEVRRAVVVLGNLSKHYDFPFRIRSGGHNKAGYSTVPGGAVLSLSNMNSISLVSSKNESEWATMEPGVRVEQVLDEVLVEHGKAGALGICGNVAEGGWVLGGGVGFMSRLLGLGIDNVKSMRVVLADGSVQVASADNEHADLFWALRGAGSGNFGVVTAMEYHLISVPQQQLFEPAYMPFGDETAEFLYRLGNLNARGEFNVVVSHLPPVKKAAAYMSWFGMSNDTNNLEHGKQYLQDVIASLLPPSASMFPNNFTFAVPQEFMWPTDTHALFDHGYGKEVYAAQTWQGFLFPENNTFAVWKEIVALMRDGMMDAPNTGPHIELWGGAISTHDPQETAFPYRNAVYNVGADIIILNDDYDDRNQAEKAFREQVAKVNSWWPKVAKFLTGAYLNYPMPSLSREEYARVYWGGNLERLVEIKQRYDPDNIFSYEQSVPLTL